MTDDDSGTTEPNHNLNESADKARGDDAEAAAEELDDLISELEERDVFQRVRDLQHTVSDDDE